MLLNGHQQGWPWALLKRPFILTFVTYANPNCLKLSTIGRCSFLPWDNGSRFLSWSQLFVCATVSRTSKHYSYYPSLSMWYPKYKLTYRLALFTGAVAVAGVSCYPCLYITADRTSDTKGHFLACLLMGSVLCTT